MLVQSLTWDFNICKLSRNYFNQTVLLFTYFFLTNDAHLIFTIEYKYVYLRFCEKATKFCKIITLDLTFTTKGQIKSGAIPCWTCSVPIQSNLRWRFHKNFWASLNIWTLYFHGRNWDFNFIPRNSMLSISNQNGRNWDPMPKSCLFSTEFYFRS